MSSTASGHQGLEFSTPSQTPLHTGFNLPDMVQAFLILQVHGGAILPVMPPSSATQSIQLCACDMTAAWLVFLFWSNERSLFVSPYPVLPSQQVAPHNLPSAWIHCSYQLHTPFALCPLCSNIALPNATQLTNAGTALGP